MVLYLRIYLQKYIGEILVIDLGRADALCVDPCFSETNLLPGTFVVGKEEFNKRVET